MYLTLLIKKLKKEKVKKIKQNKIKNKEKWILEIERISPDYELIPVVSSWVDLDR